jgi:PadR family transcriptional regulator
VNGVWLRRCFQIGCGILSNPSCRSFHDGHKVADTRFGSRVLDGHRLRPSQRQSPADAPAGTRVRLGDDVLAAPARLATGGRFALLDWLARSEWTLTCGHSKGVLVIFFLMSKGRGAARKKSEVLQGTLDLMILKTLQGMGPLHGFGIARRLEQLSEEVLRLNEGTVYTSLLRLQQEGWIVAEWGASENNRKAKFYSITKSGLKQLAKETEDWERISAVIGRVLRLASEKP